MSVGEPASRYGFYAGTNLLIPALVSSEYLVGVRVFPVPRAPRRLVGMFQLRGNAIVVIELSNDLVAGSGGREINILVLGQGNDAIGLVCEHPPQALSLTADLQQPEPEAPDWMHSALGSARQTSDGCWYEFDLAALAAASLQSDLVVATS